MPYSIDATIPPQYLRQQEESDTCTCTCTCTCHTPVQPTSTTSAEPHAEHHGRATRRASWQIAKHHAPVAIATLCPTGLPLSWALRSRRRSATTANSTTKTMPTRTSSMMTSWR
jgi:hypothetical protein